MNKTKKLTTGAMLLAIIGALMIIDRQLSYVLTTYIVLLIPVVIAAYSTMYKISDGLMLCVGLLAFTILFGSLTTYIYMPISIIVGLAVSFAISKNLDRRKISLVAIIVYIIAEVAVAYVVRPILGVSVNNQIASYTEAFNEMVKYTNLTSVSTVIGDVSSFILVVFVATVILTGLLEGFLTSLLTAFVLKRFKIKEIGLNSPLDIKMPVPVAYGLMIVTCLYMFIGNINNETLKYIILCVSAIASFALVYYGYFFVILYIRKRGIKINIFLVVLAIILLFPLSYIILVVVGFLYGSGPLRRIIES